MESGKKKEIIYPRTFGDEAAEMLSERDFLTEENLVGRARHERTVEVLSNDVKPVMCWLADSQADQAADDKSTEAFRKYYGI